MLFRLFQNETRNGWVSVCDDTYLWNDATKFSPFFVKFVLKA